jgi:hypothetical protein
MDVGLRDMGIHLDDLFVIRPVFDQTEDQLDGDARALDHGFPVAYLRVASNQSI